MTSLNDTRATKIFELFQGCTNEFQEKKNPRTNHRSFINGAILKPIMKRSTLRNNFFKCKC